MTSNLIENIQNVDGDYIVAKQIDNYRYGIDATLVDGELIVNVGDVVTPKNLEKCYYSIFDLASKNGYKTIVIQNFKCYRNSMDLDEVKQIIDDVLFESFRKLIVYILVDHIDTSGTGIDLEDLHRRINKINKERIEEREEYHLPYGTLGFMVSSSSNRRRKNTSHTYEELINIWLVGKNMGKEELCMRSRIHIDDFNSYNNNNLPSKDELLAMAVTLGLNLEETEQLLDTGKYELDSLDSRDEFIRAFIDAGYNIDHDVHELNKLLNKDGFMAIN